AQNIKNGTIQAIGKGKCNPPNESKIATAIEQKKPQNESIFGVNPHLTSILAGSSTNISKILL
ncbi:unnamed protein product, partial [marine sediment metagenome]